MAALAKFWGELSQTEPTFQVVFWIATGFLILSLVIEVIRFVFRE